MQCPSCRQENPAGARFCNGCGARLELACPACGHPNPPSSRFCNGCGAKLAGAPSVPVAADRFSAPKSYTPRHLAEKILTSKAALEGERKQVTVLFADLKGSMELLADRDPEEARKLLDPVLERMMEAVHRYEGTVNQVMGDGIMALFGAPVAHEDHAVRACYAALRMQEAVKRYAEQVRRSAGISVAIRVGLNSGEVVVRSIGSDLHMDYTAVGQTTHLAARMEQLAMPGSVLMSADTLRLAEGFIEAKPLGPANIKGLGEPVEVYEVTGAGPARTRLQAVARRGLTRFVGRDAELGQLRRAQQLAGTGHGQVVAIVGEAGVGKSRLVYEFTHSLRLQGWLVLHSTLVSHGKATSYLPVIDLLKGYFTIEDRDDLRQVREKVSGKLVTLEEALLATLPAFLALLDAPVEDAQWQALDPPQRRQRTLDAIKRLFLRESRVQPVVLVFEELHWIDSETQAVLDGLVESLPTARVLLLVNYRPEYEHRWGAKTYYTQLRIDPLPPESAEQFLDALLGEHSGLKAVKHLLVASTQGNPFFLEESVRTLVETQVLAGECGAYQPVKPLDNIQVPATVQAVLAARIDRVAPNDKRLLQVASVIGETMPFGLLQAVADVPDEELRPALGRLQAAEFLYETSLFPELKYTFKHGLTYQVAYNSLLAERRRALHARIVEAIERLYAHHRLTEEIERLADHAFRGELWDKAFDYLYRAGLKAAARSANQLAVACFERALGALSHLPPSAEAIGNAIDVRIELRYSLLALGELTRMFERLREAEELAAAHDDRRREARVSAFLGEYFWVIGDYERAVEWGLRARTIATALQDPQLLALANRGLGRSYHALGDYRQAVGFFQGAVTPGGSSTTANAWMLWCLAELGEFADSIALAEKTLRFSEANPEPYDSAVAAGFALGVLHLGRGDLAQAIASLERTIKACQHGELQVWFGIVAAGLGHAYSLSGRLGEAIPLLERAVDSDVSSGILGGQALLVSWLAEAYLRDGRTARAMECAAHALELAEQHKERGNLAYAAHVLGEIGSRRDPPDVAAAEAHYRQALALGDELGMRPLVAHCHLGLGKLSRCTGKSQEAQGHLTTAIAMYCEMDMPFWLEQAEAESKELG